MKVPRLFKFKRLWYCAKAGTKTGLGYTVTEAYGEWVELNSTHAADVQEVLS